MTFQSENQMKNLAVKELPAQLRNNAVQVIPEFDYGNGRTDLVLVDISEKYWETRTQRLNLDEPIQDKNHLISFLHLHGRSPVTEEYFYEIGAMKRRYKRQALNWLKEHGFVEPTSKNKITTATNFRRHITTTIAVELKLRKWKDALRQAKRGGSFADYKYVAIDSDHLDPALQRRNQFEQLNVGLLSIDEDGTVRKHIEPERVNPHNELYKWKLNEASVLKRTA